MKKIFRTLLIGALLLCLLLPSATLAASVDSAGNGFFDESIQGETVENDLYGTGQNVSVSGCTAGSSVIIVGQNLSVQNTTLGGSLRAAGYSISASNVTAAANATIAGYSVNLGSGVSVPGVYIAASDATFSGECSALAVAAGTVTLNGTVNGDAKIYAETVTIGENAVVTGTLHVEASSQPAIPAGAEIGELAFTQSEAAAATEGAADTAAVAAKGAGILGKLKGLIMMVPGRILLAVLYFFLIGNSVRNAGGMLTARPVPMLLSGLVAMIVLPVAAILLMLLYIGVPAGVLLLCLYGLAMGFSVSFCGCAVGQRVFPKMHGLLAAILGVTAFSLVKLIPYLGGLLTFASMLFTLGYFIQVVYLRLRKPDPAAAAPATPVPEASQPEAPAPEGDAQA